MIIFCPVLSGYFLAHTLYFGTFTEQTRARIGELSVRLIKAGLAMLTEF